MTDFLSKYLTPSQISKVYGLIALVSVIGLGVFLAEVTLPEKRVAPEKTDVTNIITASKSRELGLDAVSDKIKLMERKIYDLEDDATRLAERNEKLEKHSKDSIALAKELKKTQQELELLKDEAEVRSKEFEERVNEKVASALKEQQIQGIFNEQDGSSSTASKSGSQPKPMGRPEFQQNTSDKIPTVSRKKSNVSAFHYGTNDIEPVLDEQSTLETSSVVERTSHEIRNENLMTTIEPATVMVQEPEDAEIYVPKGAILTGVIITGIDAPTTSTAQENPMPALIRIKKEAILPNFVTLQEVRECFALMAGYGDLGSERAHFRGESITCVRHDGSVIESDFASYAVGEDGKAGIKGTLVTRNSTVLANSMMAGFASGLASAFNVTPVPVVSTDPSGTQQYQDVYSSAALQGGAAQGASKAMDSLADYYLKLADAIHPVIEISSGRTIDMVVTEGALL
jgi:conjugal transfer pilus assembly protein TraB